MSSPFKLDHVALGLRRMSDGLPLVRDLLGGVYVAEMPEGVFRWTQWRFANGGVLELLEPDGPPGGFLHRFLEARGPGFHHVTFKVPDLAAAAIDRAVGLDAQGAATGQGGCAFDNVLPNRRAGAHPPFQAAFTFGDPHFGAHPAGLDTQIQEGQHADAGRGDYAVEVNIG